MYISYAVTIMPHENSYETPVAQNSKYLVLPSLGSAALLSQLNSFLYLGVGLAGG
jgi:hypothetical protein